MNKPEAVVEPQPRDWEARFRQSRHDRVVLTKFLAACLIVVGLINAGPALSFLYQCRELDQPGAVPRWVWLQIFVALIHLIYAIYLMQIPDWASLRAVSITMLAVAMAFAATATGLLGSSGNAVLPAFLQLDGSQIRQARLWCVAMLCVATAASYVGGRGSAKWQRAEKLFFAARAANQ